MSIGSSPFQGGGSASIADATESTAGKIRIATTSESTAGTNDTTAMTPAKVKARIDAALVGGIDYKGTFNATTGLTNSGGNLNNAEQGDLYVIDTAGTIYGATWAVGDHLLINADMGGSISNSKIDKVDNTESDTLDTVTGRGATTSNAVQVGGLNIAGSYALPTSDGSAGQILKTDGSGALTFQSLGSISTQAANSVNITGGAISGITDLAIADGGTGASTEAQARTNLGLAIGSDVQAFDAQLTDVAGLTPADGAFIVGDGSNFVAESGATVRASLGLAIGSDVQAFDAQLTDVAGLTPSNNHVIVGDGSNFTAAQLDLNKLSDVSYTAGASIDNYVLTYDHSSTSWGAEAVGASSDTLDTVTGRGATTSNAVQVGGLNIAGSYALPTSDGSAGQILKTDGSGALTFQSLGSISTQAANSVNITGGAISGITDLAIADGGTGASTEAQARTNLGLAIGSDVQAFDAQLTDVAGLTPADGAFIVGDGSNFVAESGSTARASLGLAIGSDVQAFDAQLTDVAGLTPADGAFIVGDGSNFVAESGATARTSLGLAIGSDVQAFDAQLTDVAGLTPADGAFIVGDGSNFVAESGATARASLGLVIGTDVLSDVIQDTSPQLGGNLDLNGQDIVTTSNANLELAPDGTGVVSIKGNTTGGNNQGALKLWCENNSHGIALKSPPHSASASYNLILPTGVGTDGQVLKTDGGDSSTPKNVQLSWVDQSGGGGGSVPDVTSASPSGAYTISTHTGIEEIYLLTPSADIVVNIPAASAATSGFKYQIKNLSASYNLTITPASSTIDGSSTYVTTQQYESITCVSNGLNWFII